MIGVILTSKTNPGRGVVGEWCEVIVGIWELCGEDRHTGIPRLDISESLILTAEISIYQRKSFFIRDSSDISAKLNLKKENAPSNMYPL
jgi:hypothetical protein